MHKKKKKLFVGSLAFSVTDEELRSAFSQVGKVLDVRIPKDFKTGDSKGFGFVEMESEEEAEQAIQMLNGKEIKGRPIVVSVARENPAGNKKPFSRNFRR